MISYDSTRRAISHLTATSLFAFIALIGLAGTALGQIVINEVRYDYWQCYEREFVELKGPGGTNLDGYTLVGIDGADGSVYRTVDLSGHTIPADGYFVVAMNGVPGADLVDSGAWQDGPDAIELRLGMTTVDALCYGASGLTCEGSPAPDVPTRTCLARCPDGTDTGDNAADFALDTLGSAGLPNDLGETCEIPAPTGACCGSCDCWISTQDECNQELGGVYMGDGTTCDPDLCSSCPPGACCFPDGSCVEWSEIECDCLSGAFMGSTTTCDPNPCFLASAPSSDGSHASRLMLGKPEPNPASGRVQFAFELGEGSQIRIDLYDVSGGLVATIASGWYEAGLHHVSIGPAQIPKAAGKYFLQLRSGAETRSRPLTVLGR